MTTAAEMRAALARRFAAPAYGILFEVPDATGGQHSRIADAIAMSLWPSRGLELNGIEIKVSRSDWRHELERPAKAEVWHRRCDRWWLATPTGVVTSEAEVPATWGWLELKGDQFAVRREAAVNGTPMPLDRLLLASLFRRMSKSDDALVSVEIERRDRERKAEYDQRVKDAVDRRFAHSRDAAQIIQEFEEASGIKIDGEYRGAKTVGKAVRFILESGVIGGYRSAFTMADEMRQVAEDIEKAAADLGIPRPPPMTSFTKRRKGKG